MANIVITDLLDSRQLDKKAMATLLGGCGGGFGSYSWIRPFMRLKRPHGGFVSGPATSSGGSGTGAGSLFQGDVPNGVSAIARSAFSFERELTLTFSFKTRFNATEEIAFFNS